MANEAHTNHQTLDLTDARERPTVKLPDGKTVELRFMDEFSIADSRYFQSLASVDIADDAKLEELYTVLEKIMIGADAEAVKNLSIGHVQRILNFFSEVAAPTAVETLSSMRSASSSDSTADPPETG